MLREEQWVLEEIVPLLNLLGLVIEQELPQSFGGDLVILSQVEHNIL